MAGNTKTSWKMSKQVDWENVKQSKLMGKWKNLWESVKTCLKVSTLVGKCRNWWEIVQTDGKIT